MILTQEDVKSFLNNLIKNCEETLAQVELEIEDAKQGIKSSGGEHASRIAINEQKKKVFSKVLKHLNKAYDVVKGY